MADPFQEVIYCKPILKTPYKNRAFLILSRKIHFRRTIKRTKFVRYNYAKLRCLLNFTQYSESFLVYLRPKPWPIVMCALTYAVRTYIICAENFPLEIQINVNAIIKYSKFIILFPHDHVRFDYTVSDPNF